MSFGERLQAVMDTLGFRPADFARELGCSSQNVSNWTKRKDPTDAALSRVLIRFPFVNPDYLLGKSEVMFFENHTSFPRENRYRHRVPEREPQPRPRSESTSFFEILSPDSNEVLVSVEVVLRVYKTLQLRTRWRPEEPT